jgi:hypothetical protein
LLLYLTHPTSAKRQHVIVQKENDVATSAPCTNIALLREVKGFAEMFQHHLRKCRKSVDDYLWGEPRDSLHRPKVAVDAFLNIFAEQLEIVNLAYQAAIQKRMS